MRFTAAPLAKGTPYPEVTESICLVPEQTITRAPENTLLVHLCRFVVRILQFSLADFPGIRPGGFRSHGMLTVCPSATPFGLTLGSD